MNSAFYRLIFLDMLDYPCPATDTRRMKPGDLIGERFVLEALAGEGGMGQVFRATDRRAPNSFQTWATPSSPCSQNRCMISSWAAVRLGSGFLAMGVPP
jgi:hypothetical protein